MAAPQQAQVYQTWFGIADEDKDGAIAGVEAVRFFGRSGLDQATLGQIWELASGGSAKLNHAQFSSALRLVALAQQSGGRLPLEQARVTLAGLGPSMPIPRMQGMEQFGGPSYSPQPTGAAPAAPGVAVPGAQVPQQQAFAAAGYVPQFTGAGYTPQMTGAGAWPPATPADMARYAAAFTQLDADRDGLVQGADCFGYFMQWGLDKAVLRHIWEIVAGTSGSLTQVQLVQCLYLMDQAKRGLRPPPALPPGPFPPVAGGAAPWSLQSQFGAGGAAAPPPSQAVQPLPAVPTMPVRYQEPAKHEEAAAAAPKPSQVPLPGAGALAGFSEAERSRLQAEAAEAREKEAALAAAEEEASRTKARLAAFNAALQEVTVFKSRCEVSLLSAQDAAARLQDELEGVKKKYDQSYAAAASQGEAAKAARDQLSTLLASKAEVEGKLAALEAEMAAAASVTPADVARMEAELAALNQQVAAREAAAAAAGAHLRSLKEQRAALEARRAEVAAQDVEGQAAREAEALAKEMAEAKSGGAVGAVLAGLLSKAARMYRNLYQAVQSSGAEVPFDALPSALGLATWVDDALAGAVGWNDMDDDARGYVLVNALPGQAAALAAAPMKLAPAAHAPAHVPVPATAAAAVAAVAPAAAAPIAADAFGEPPAFGAVGFGDANAFGEPPAFGSSAAPAPAPAAPAPAQAVTAVTAVTAVAPPAPVDAFGEAPAFGGAPAFGAPAPASAAGSAGGAGPAAAASAPEAASGFGDDAFGAPPAFPAPAQGQVGSQGGAAAPAAAASTGFDDNAFA